MPIRGDALLDRWLALLFHARIDRILINTHWLAERVNEHVAASTYRDKIDLVYEPALLGTAGTILANRGYFGEAAFLVAHADNLTDFDVPALLAAHAKRPPHCCLTMLAFDTDAPRTCGILQLDDESVVRAFHEKVEDPPGTLANAAVYILEPEVTAFIAALGRDIVDFSTEVIPAFIGRILAVKTEGYHRDIGTPESLAEAEADVLAGRL